MNKKKLIIIGAMGIIFCIGVITFLTIPAIKKHPKINPEIFPVFRSIERHCESYLLKDKVKPQEYERCKGVYELHKVIKNTEHYPATDYYRDLERLGFELPPLYEEGINE